MKKKTRCYIYTRVSTAIQVDGYSLDAQKDKLRKYAEFQDMEIVGEYSDEGHSEKKQFMQAFIELIDIFTERREDGNWIRNIKFRFPLPILRDGKEVVRVDGISLDKEQPDEHTVTLEKFPTLETVVALHHQRPTVGSQNNPISGGQ